MNGMSTTSRFLALFALAFVVWIKWPQNSNTTRKIPDSIHEAIRHADIEFLSLSPKEHPDNPHAEQFRGFEILGSMKVPNRSTRIAMINALDNAVGKNELTDARCFWPRHGIRCSHNGDQIELIVCFECAPLIIYVNDELILKTEVGISPKALYDQILLSKKLPINTSPFDTPIN